MILRSSLSYVPAQLRCPTHLLECPHWASLRVPEVALAAKECLRRTRRRFHASFRRTDICIFWRLGFRQSSFHLIARTARCAAPYAWTQPPLQWHALFPYCPFGLRLAIRFKNNPPSPSRLHREYNRAPRGAISPYHAGPATRRPRRLGAAAASMACCCPLHLSDPGQPSDPKVLPPSPSRLSRGYSREVGPERPASVTAGGFLRTASRTRRAPLSAPGSSHSQCDG